MLDFRCFGSKWFGDSSQKSWFCRTLDFFLNSLLTEPAAPTARPPAGGSIRSPTSPRRSLRSPTPSAEKKKNRKNISEKIWRQKILKKKKIRENFFEIFFFFDFPKFFSVEIFYLMSRLRMQNFSIISQGVPEIQDVTHRQTQDEDLLYRFKFFQIGLKKSNSLLCKISSPLE